MWRNLCSLLIMGLLQLALAQRPSFAGQRPPDGLTQTDKYRGTQNTAVENITGVDIGTRFGGDAVTQQAPSINLPYGATQKLPVGVPLVFSVSSYRPIAGSVAPTASVAPAASAASVEFANRIDGFDNRPIASSNGVFASAANPPTSNALPIDAHGDQQYVNYLSQLPVDNQPFWFLNYQAIEALRNSSRPNVGALETRGSFFGG